MISIILMLIISLGYTIAYYRKKLEQLRNHLTRTSERLTKATSKAERVYNISSDETFNKFVSDNIKQGKTHIRLKDYQGINYPTRKPKV